MESAAPDKPTVAILLASYNGEKYIAEQLDSILHQTFPDFVCYIHDDGSSDSTRMIESEYAQKYPEQIKIIEGDATGSAKENFLFLLREAEADFYFFCDQDDFWLPDKVEKELSFIQIFDNTIPQCVYTDLIVTDSSLNHQNTSFYKLVQLNPLQNTVKPLLMNNACVGCTMLLNRKTRDLCIQKPYPSVIMHDWLAALCAVCFGELHYLDTPTVLYRQHANNVIGATGELGFVGKIKRAADLKAFIERKKYYTNRPVLMARDMLAAEASDGNADLRIHDGDAQFLKQMAVIDKAGKPERVRFYMKNALYRQRINKLWQLLWI